MGTSAWTTHRTAMMTSVVIVTRVLSRTSSSANARLARTSAFPLRSPGASVASVSMRRVWGHLALAAMISINLNPSA
jgi:hypothetical protein